MNFSLVFREEAVFYRVIPYSRSDAVYSVAGVENDTLPSQFFVDIFFGVVFVDRTCEQPLLRLVMVPIGFRGGVHYMWKFLVHMIAGSGCRHSVEELLRSLPIVLTIILLNLILSTTAVAFKNLELFIFLHVIYVARMVWLDYLGRFAGSVQNLISLVGLYRR